MKTALRVIKDLVRKYPNDMELGGRVRHFIYQLENTEQDYRIGRRNGIPIKSGLYKW